MGLEEVKKQIIEDAKKQAKLLLDEAKNEAKKIESEAGDELKGYEKQLSENNEKMLEIASKRESASAEFDGKKMLLDAKREMLNQAVEKARASLSRLPAETRKKALNRMLEKAKQEIEVKKVCVNEKDIELVKGVDNGVDVKKAEITGGMITETADGKVSLNWSYDSTLELVKEKYLRELSEVLFR